MAKYFSNPNPYSNQLSKKFNHNFFILISAGAGVAFAYLVSKTINIFLALLGYVVLIIFIYLARQIFKQMGKNDRGELAEIQVKKTLLELPDSYSVFQNVLIKSDLDIDFVVVGPKGVFAVEVKSHKSVNFFSRKKFIRQLRSETMLLKELLQSEGIRTYVQPILVFTRATVYHKARYAGVCVTSPEFLLTYIAQSKQFNYDKVRAENIVASLYKTNK